MAKPVRLRRAAVDDITAATAFLLNEAGAATAHSFVDALETALAHVARFPHTGTLRFAHQLDLPGPRAWPLRRFPYIVFCVERDTEFDVWRVLHSRRDIGASLLDPDQI